VLLHWHRSIAKMCKKAKTGTPSSKSDLGTSNALIRSTITSSKTRSGLKRRLAESSGFIAQAAAPAAAGRDAGEEPRRGARCGADQPADTPRSFSAWAVALIAAAMVCAMSLGVWRTVARVTNDRGVRPLHRKPTRSRLPVRPWRRGTDGVITAG